MKRKSLKRIAAVALAVAMTAQSTGSWAAVQAQDVQVRTQSETQMSSDKEVVYVNTYDTTKREHDFDANWKFYLGDASGAESKNFDDSKWTNVNIPHDYSIEQEYSKTGEAESAYLLGGTGWYRKHFNLAPDMEGKEIRIDFGGVYMNATIWVNGEQLGTHPYGYTPFSFDITDYVSFDQENVITVKVDHQTPSSRWYSGSGIYRDVNLTVMNKVHVDLDGTQVIVSNLKEQQGGKVDVEVNTNVVNAGSEEKEVVLTHTIYEKGTETSIGTVTTDAVSVAAGETKTIASTLQADNPKLWGLGEENAHLYNIVTEVKVADAVVDTYETEYGFRYTEYNTETGFYLNGQAVKLQGVCMHHDQGSLGSEAHYRAIERQVELLQEMGCNSIRVTHNPAADALIEICNEKGVLVINELFDGWMYSKNGNTYDYAQWFNKTIEAGNEIIGAEDGMTWAKFDLRATINRGKNDPSIIMWSLGNEIQEGAGGSGYAAMADKLIEWAQEVDTTKELTIGSNAVKNAVGNANNEHIQIGNKLTAVGGTSGTNYSGGASYDALHSTYPDWYLYGSETASHINSRGVYYKTGGNSNKELTAYDKSAVGWGATASSAWYDVITRDFVFGEYVWTGFDYLGEPTTWNGTSAGAVGDWPSPKNSYFGIIDTAGLPKDNYYFYQSQWNDEVNTLHVLPAWNKDVVVSGNVPIVVYSDAAAVELFFTNEAGERTSLGKKTFTEKRTEAGYTYQIYEGEGKSSTAHENLYLTWYKAFEAGKIEAVAYDKEGNVIQNTVGRSVVQTTGSEAKLQAKADRTEIKADGKDLTYITVDVTDEKGNIVPDAANNVKFVVEGDGVLVGVDNGKQADHQSYQDDNRNAYNGSLVAIVQSTKEAGSFTVTAQSEGLQSATVVVTTVADQEDTTAEARVDAFYMSKYYYVKTGNKVVLPTTVETRYTDGTEKELNVVWDEVTQTTGSFGVSGIVDGQYQVSVIVNIIDEVAALLNYSTTTPVGQPAVLPDARPAVMADGSILNVSFPVAWDNVDASAYNEAGTFVVQGTANVLGKAISVTATVRVQSETVTVTGSVDDPHTLTQNIPEEKQSDTLSAIWDGKTEVGSNTNGGANPTCWTNYAYSQDGNTTAEIVFEYATQQRVGKMAIHFFSDSFSARYPEEGTTKVYISETGKDDAWTEVAMEETIGEEVGRVKEYSYTFTPFTATFIKFCITNTTQATGTSAKACTGITEIEIKKAVGSFVTNTAAKLSALTVNGTELTAAELAKNVYYTLDKTAVVEATAADNGSVTVLAVHEDVIRLIIESEDHKTRETFTIYLGQEAPLDPADASNDYPLSKITYETGSEQSQSGNEGPVRFAFDNNESTYWHSSWNPSWYGTEDCANHLWVQFNFPETVKASAVRYLARGGNGDITGYRVEGKTSADAEWTTLTTGTWSRDGQQWYIAQFQETEVVALRLVATATSADSGMNKFAAARELRVVGTGVGGTTPEPGLVIVPGEDYPLSGITPTAGSTHGSSLGSALDNNTDTFWETDWGSGVDNTGKLWYQLELEEAAKIDQLRYYPRYQGTNLNQGQQNGFVSKYRVEVSMTGEDDSWTKVAEGTWSPADQWFTVEFNAVEAKYVRLVGVETLSNGNAVTKDMCIAEIRVRVAEENSVDKSALEAAIAEAKALNEADYTPSTWNTLKDALAFAEEVKNDADATQDEVNAKEAALKAAITGLVGRADTTKLAKAMADAAKLKETDYTPKSWKVLSDALSVAEAAKNDADATQTSVDIATKAVEDAIKALVVRADKTALNNKIQEAKAIQNKEYTEASWTALQKAVKAAEVVSNNADASDADVKAALDTLSKAIDGLKVVEKPVEPSAPATKEDKQDAKDYLEGCKDFYTKDDFQTEEEWTAYQEALTELEDLLAQEDITKGELQAAIDRVNAIISEEVPGDPEQPSKPELPSDDKQDAVTTGDNNSLMTWAIVLLIAAGAVVVAVVLRRRNQR